MQLTGPHSAAGFVMSSDSRFVTSDRSSATADTSGCAAASFWLSAGGSATGGAAALATSAILCGFVEARLITITSQMHVTAIDIDWQHVQKMLCWPCGAVASNLGIPSERRPGAQACCVCCRKLQPCDRRRLAADHNSHEDILLVSLRSNVAAAFNRHHFEHRLPL